MRFRWSPEVKGDGFLKAGRRKVYRNVDERCRACKVKGGRARPCGLEKLGIRDNPHGYPCPRREWPDLDSPALSTLVQLAASGESAALFARGWEIEFGDRPRAVQARLFRRVLRAHGDELLRLALRPWLADTK